MNRKFSILKSMLVAALAAGGSGLAHADMGRFDSGYQYFFRQPIDKAPSAWRHANPDGLSQLELEAQSSDTLAKHFEQPTFEKAPSEWRQVHKNGVEERDLQVLSSKSTLPATPAVASTNEAAAVAKTAAK